jgi:cellobiose-specific phosphotransferase system component IIC
MTEEKPKKIILSRETLIPAGALVLVVGGVFWLSQMFSQVQANRADISKISASIDSILEEQSDVTDRMARMETKLDIIIDSLK